MIVVYLNDVDMSYEEAAEYFEEAGAWASRQCQTFVDFDVQDTSDVSYIYDQVAGYRFKDPKDALMFELKWKSS